MKKILVVGGGSIGKRHAKNLLSLGEKDVTIVEPNQERRKQIETEIGIPTVDWEVPDLHRNQYSIAFICSPSYKHLEQAEHFAKWGCDFFIEKPLSTSMRGVQKLLKLTKLKKLITMVGSNWKFYPSFKKMKELLDSGAIGRVLSARCQFGSYLPDWHPWEDHRKGYSANKKFGGGILLDSHEFDYLTWFLGKKVKKIACFADRIGEVTVDTEDAAEAILQFEDGAIGEIHQDYLQRFPARNFEFFGVDGTIAWDMNAKKVMLKSKTRGEESFPLPEPYDINTMYITEAKHFLQCVESRSETVTPIGKGAYVLELICAAKKSAESAKVIRL